MLHTFTCSPNRALTVTTSSDSPKSNMVELTSLVLLILADLHGRPLYLCLGTLAMLFSQGKAECLAQTKPQSRQVAKLCICYVKYFLPCRSLSCGVVACNEDKRDRLDN